MKFFPLISLLFCLALSDVQAGGEAKLQFGEHRLTVELAISEDEQATGLMNRMSIGPERGMLFVFPEPKPASFWMRNTSIPLDLAFLDADGVILEIHALVPFEEKPVESRSARVKYAVEANRDWFASRNLKPGLKVKGLPGI